MAEALTVTTECVDDIPLLITWMERMGLVTLINEHFPPHGNWQGLDPGRVLVGWLAHILSEADHRLNQVEEWAAKRLETLSGCLGVAVRALDSAMTVWPVCSMRWETMSAGRRSKPV
jgi:hypothetical protein